jgi:hypothetical protein
MGENLGEGMDVVLSLFQMFFKKNSYLSYLCSFTQILFVYFFLPPLYPFFLLSFLFKKIRCTLVLEIGNAHYKFFIF